MVAIARTTEVVSGSPAKHLFDSAVLVTADQDDLAFAIQTVRDEHASFVPLSVDLDGVASSAIVWVRDAKLVAIDGEYFWFLRARLTDVVSRGRWSSGLNKECSLVVPASSSTQNPEPNCFLTGLTS